MREIKFRARYKHGILPVLGQTLLNEGTWVYGDLRHRKVVPCIYDDEAHTYPIDPETIGQFTGIRDENGREIYEGDIISYFEEYDMENTHKYVGEVIFEEGVFWVRSKKQPYAMLRMLAFDMPTSTFQVIGNVYENRNLLK